MRPTKELKKLIAYSSKQNIDDNIILISKFGQLSSNIRCSKIKNIEHIQCTESTHIWKTHFMGVKIFDRLALPYGKLSFFFCPTNKFIKTDLHTNMNLWT